MKTSQALNLPTDTASRRQAIYKRVEHIGRALGEHRCFQIIKGACQNLMARNRPVWNFEYFLYALYHAYNEYRRAEAMAASRGKDEDYPLLIPTSETPTSGTPTSGPAAGVSESAPHSPG